MLFAAVVRRVLFNRQEHILLILLAADGTAFSFDDPADCVTKRLVPINFLIVSSDHIIWS